MLGGSMRGGPLQRCQRLWRRWYVNRTMPLRDSLQEQKDGGFWVSAQRMAEFLEAEVTHLAALPRKALSLEDLLSASASPTSLARFAHREIPKRFAARMERIREVPNWNDDDDLVSLRQTLRASFDEVRMVDIVGEDIAPMTRAIRSLNERQTKALPAFARVLGMLHRRVGDVAGTREGRARWEEWAHRFARSRLASEMLMAQYLAIIEQVDKGVHEVTGIVDPNCDPVKICQQAAHTAQEMCLERFGIEPLVHIDVRSTPGASFSYIPTYLYAILLEVLRYSCETTVQSRLTSMTENIFENTIHVVICADDHRVAIRVRDKAGGVPFEYVDGMWDFLSPELASDAQLQDSRGRARPLGHCGLGLPYARLTAKYLGGMLSLQSLPDYGTDAHLFLPRIDVAPILRDLKN